MRLIEIQTSFVVCLLALICCTAAYSVPQHDGEVIEITEQTKAAFDDYEQGELLLLKGKFAEAEPKLRRGLEFAPKNKVVLYNLGSVSLHLGKYEDSIRYLEQLVKEWPNYGDAWITLGGAYTMANKTQEALNAYKQYLRSSPRGDKAPVVSAIIPRLEAELKKRSNFSPAATWGAAGPTDDYFNAAVHDRYAKWPGSRMPIPVYIKPGDDVPHYKPAFMGVVKKAFADWSAASAGKISFNFVNQPEDSGISCSWTADTSQLASKAEAGQTMVIPDLEGIKTVKILLPTVLPGESAAEMSEIIALRAALHEVGHAIGIAGHSPQPKDVMFYMLDISPDEPKLSPRDLNTLHRLYSDTSPVASASKPAIMFSKPTGTYQPQSDWAKDLVVWKKAMAEGDMPEAKTALEAAVKESKSFNADDPRLAQTCNSEGLMLLNQEDPAAALPFFQQALAIWQKQPSLDPSLENTTTTLNNLGECYKMLGKFAEAEPMFQRAVSLTERMLGPESMQFIAELDNLAILYDLEGKYEKAEPLYKRCIDYYQTQKSPSAASIMRQYAHLLRRTNRIAEAEKMETDATTPPEHH